MVVMLWVFRFISYQVIMEREEKYIYSRDRERVFVCVYILASAFFWATFLICWTYIAKNAIHRCLECGNP